MTIIVSDLDLSGLHEMHRSSVAPAECDDNGHLNVQHYVGRFAGATAGFIHSQNPKIDTKTQTADIHLRFHRELRERADTVVRSGVVGEGEYAGRVLHLLSEGGNGSLCATALDLSGAELTGLPVINGALPDLASPRSLPGDAYRPVDTDRLLDRDLALPAHSGAVKVAECDESGKMKADSMVGRFFRAAMSLWSFSGFELRWFSDNGYGGIAVEMKLTRFAEIQAGRPFTIVSWVPRMTNNLLDLANQMIEMPSGKPVARICAASMVFDKKTRRPVDFPQAVRDYHFERFAGFGAVDIA